MKLIINKPSKSDIRLMVILWMIFLPWIYLGTTANFGYPVKFAHIFVDILFIWLIVYLVVYILYPTFFVTKQYALFAITFLIVLFLESNFYYHFFSLVYVPADGYFSFILNDGIENAKNLGLFLGFLLAKKFYETESINMKLEKESKANQLKWLQSQIDPHFLFNNLNALDDLIDRDPNSAKKYLHKLSTLYRYLIGNQDNDVVSLEKEWDFVDNYIYLIKERYGAIYSFEKVNEIGDLYHLLIPPASLQGLVENVVKHNYGSEEKPLKVTMRIDKKGISVEHTKRLKRKGVISHGTGLQNLSTRYELLSNQKITIEDNGIFKVTLPHIQLLN